MLCVTVFNMKTLAHCDYTTVITQKFPKELQNSFGCNCGSSMFSHQLQHLCVGLLLQPLFYFSAASASSDKDYILDEQS